jgi:hypothetical protein
MAPSTRTTMMDALLPAAGLFTLLTGIVEAVRIFAIESIVDPGLALLGLAAMIVGGLTAAAVGLAVWLGHVPPSLPRTVAVTAGWLILWFPLTIALGIATDMYPTSQLAATALCLLCVSAAVAALVRSGRGVPGTTHGSGRVGRRP